MGDKRSFNDAFAPRKPQGTDGFTPAKTPDVARTPAGKAAPTDAFKPAPKPAKPVMAAKPAKTEPPKDAFARKAPEPTKVGTAKPVKAEASRPARVKPEAKMQRPPAPQKVVAPKPEVALKPVQQAGAKLPPLVRTSEPPPAKTPPLVAQPIAAKQPAMVRAEPVPKPRNLFGRSGGEPKAKQPALTPSVAPRASGMTSPPKRDGGKVPAMAFATALPKPHGGAGYNPFDRRRFVKSPVPPVEEAIAGPASAPEPFFDLPPELEQPPVELSPPAPEQRRAPLHVVPSAATVDAVSMPKPPKIAARSSSLVLVSGAGAVAAAEAADAPEAPPAEKPPEKQPEKQVEKPAEAAPAAAAAEPAPQVAKVKRGGGGSRGGGDGTRPPARAVAHRGFNQDDLFGVLFGIAVIAFLLMWFMRGKAEEAEDGTLFAAQSAPVQRLAVSPTAPLPAPLPPADPFGQGPVDLKPQGPVLEALPPPPESAEVAPAAPPPTVAAKPSPAPVPTPAETTLPLAERKMHAWFCTASTRLTKAARNDLGGELDKFAQVFAGKELVVRGYADTRGSLQSNTELGGNRANVVADFLRTKGLTVVDVQGVGELDGLDDNQNCANQRRVDVWVKDGPAETPSRACAPEPDVEALVCG